MTPETLPLFQRLFFETEGFIDWNGCSKDQVALTCRNPSEGSLFTRALSRTLLENLENQDPDYRWTALWKDVVTATQNDFAEQCPRGFRFDGGRRGRTVQRTQTPAQLAFDARRTNVVQRIPNRVVPGGGVGGENAGDPDLERLGITVQAIDGVPQVTTVRKGSPAMQLNKAGAQDPWKLELGDRILSVDGEDVDCVNCLARALAKTGEITTLVVLNPKDGLRYQFTVPLRKRAPRQLGVFVENFGRVGARVTGVVPDSPATQLNRGDGQTWRLEAGDVIQRINGELITGEQAVRDAVERSGPVMDLQVLGRDGRQYRFHTRLGSD